MTKTNRVAAACGVMLLGAMASQFGAEKAEPVEAATIINDPQPTPELAHPIAEPHGTAKGQEAPAVEWLTLEEAQRSGRPYFVFQHYADPALDKACRPCRVIEKLMRDPEVVAVFTDRGVLTSGTVEDWQKGSPLPAAPAIGYVSPSAKEGDAVPIIKGLDPPRVPTGFRLESKEAFIADVKAWIDNESAHAMPSTSVGVTKP